MNIQNDAGCNMRLLCSFGSMCVSLCSATLFLMIFMCPICKFLHLVFMLIILHTPLYSVCFVSSNV